MQKTPNYSKKILKILSENRAISVPDLAKKVLSDTENDTVASKYALNRSLKGLLESGAIERHFSGQNDYARLTRAGKRKAVSLQLESDTTLVPNWDGQWRIVLLDLPESRKSEREALRYLLKKAGFELLKNSAWISPFPYEHLFMNIKKDLGLTTEMMVMTTNNLDPETQEELVNLFQK
jgi:DNA-binding transcriptional regulator PaaX